MILQSIHEKRRTKKSILFVVLEPESLRRKSVWVPVSLLTRGRMGEINVPDWFWAKQI